jgi:hypothetical protein
MGYHSDRLKKIQSRTPSSSKITQPKINKRRKDSSLGSPFSDILSFEDEAMRVFRYINDSDKNSIVDTDSAVEHGVDKLGTKGDADNFFGYDEGLISSADKRDKLFAARLYRDEQSKSWDDAIKLKSGRKIIGKRINERYYVKRIEYERKGRVVTYTQARDVINGRIIKMNSAKRFLK